MNNFVNQNPFLRTSREIPEDLHQLSVEVNKLYVDVANAVNFRTIGLYPASKPAITGDSWFLINGKRQQTIRQIYTFTSLSNIDLGFKLTSISQISPKCYGSFTDGINWYGLLYGSNVAIAGQISFYILSTGSTTSDQIAFLSGAGSPTLSTGTIVIEWISNV